MQPGEVSDVFQTEFGYHIVQLHEKLPERKRTFEEARDDVTRRLKEEQLRNAIDQLVDNLKSNATIEEEPDDEAGGNS
jgi:parvulin-like peptidyl-prolyl isomerase